VTARTLSLQQDVLSALDSGIAEMITLLHRRGIETIVRLPPPPPVTATNHERAQREAIKRREAVLRSLEEVLDRVMTQEQAA